jgi:hypothetical protein
MGRFLKVPPPFSNRLMKDFLFPLHLLFKHNCTMHKRTRRVLFYSMGLSIFSCTKERIASLHSESKH